MEFDLGSVKVPLIDQTELALARSLASESTDERVVKLCNLVIDLEPKLRQIEPDFRRVFENLQRRRQ
jgi:hypothetical protein